MFLFGLSLGIAAAFVLLMVCLTIFTGRENKRPQWHTEYERKNDIYMTQMVSTWKKVSAALENIVASRNELTTTQGEKCLCELECNSGLGRNILEINEHCPVHGKFWA